MSDGTQDVTNVTIIGTCQYYCRGLSDVLMTDGFTCITHIVNDVLTIVADDNLLNNLLDGPINALTPPHLVFLGHNLAPKRLFDLARKIIMQHPKSRVILHANFLNNEMAQIDAAHIGVSACLAGQISDEALLVAVRAVANGHMTYTPEIMRLAHKIDDLSFVQQQIVNLWSEGKHDSEIANELNLKPKTVRNYGTIILEKLQVHDRRTAVMRAKHQGWI